MKVALFLYPITPYINAVCDGGSAQERGLALQRILQKRYRDRGWKVAWALFSRDGDPSTPDTSLLWTHVVIQSEDAIVTVPISFRRHCGEKVYPSARRIVSSLGSISRLAVIGFHRDDCVERVARAAWRMGIQTKVHDDLTEHFFIFEFFKDPNEESRARPSWRRVSHLRDPSDRSLRPFRSRRAKELERICQRKPWLLQIT